jgi:hypothetical protein
VDREFISLLIQIPIVAAFIWYSLKLQERYQASMDKRDAQMELRDKTYLSALAAISSSMQAHDMKTDMAISRMEERTRPREKVNLPPA